MKLSIGFITGRFEPHLDWFLDALKQQLQVGDEAEVIVVDALHDKRQQEFRDACTSMSPCPIKFIPVKPNVWQGKYRLTTCDWWALSNARNTFVASAKYDWLATLDDRMVPCPGWLEAIRAANNGRYGVCGTYKKVTGLQVEFGKPTFFDAPNRVMDQERGHATDGIDHRLKMVRANLTPCRGDWWFGGSFSEATEWAMMVNGHCEDADGCALNDVLYGQMMERNGIHLKFDATMAIVEDRTPALSGPEYMRCDKGKSPNDKSHALLKRTCHLKKCNNPFGDMRTLRQHILAGGEFPIIQQPTVDWYDNQPLKDMPRAPWYVEATKL